MQDPEPNRKVVTSETGASVIRCLLTVVLIILLAYASLGLITGILIIPPLDSESEALRIEGIAARVGGASILLMYTGIFVAYQPNYLESRKLKIIASMLLGSGFVGIITSVIISMQSN